MRAHQDMNARRFLPATAPIPVQKSERDEVRSNRCPSSSSRAQAKRSRIDQESGLLRRLRSSQWQIKCIDFAHHALVCADRANQFARLSGSPSLAKVPPKGEMACSKDEFCERNQAEAGCPDRKQIFCYLSASRSDEGRVAIVTKRWVRDAMDASSSKANDV